MGAYFLAYLGLRCIALWNPILNRFNALRLTFFGARASLQALHSCNAGCAGDKSQKQHLEPRTNGGKAGCKEMVPEEGVEPTRPCGHRILSPARLPVPPLRASNSK